MVCATRALVPPGYPDGYKILLWVFNPRIGGNGSASEPLFLSLRQLAQAVAVETKAPTAFNIPVRNIKIGSLRKFAHPDGTDASNGVAGGILGSRGTCPH